MRPITTDLNQVSFNALDSLARHKYMMFGYWAAIWTYLNRCQAKRQPSPFGSLAKEAKRILLERR